MDRSLAEELERRARLVLGRAQQWTADPATSVAREIILTLTTIDDVRALHQRLEEARLAAECATGTARLQATEPAEHARHEQRLQQLAAERQQHAFKKQEQLAALHQLLLGQLTKYAYLADNDDRAPPSETGSPHA